MQKAVPFVLLPTYSASVMRVTPADDTGDLPRGSGSVAGSVARFTVAGLLVALALVVLTAVQARRAGAEQARHAFENLARVAAATLSPVLDTSPTADAATGRILQQQVAALRRAGPVVRVEVVDAAGRVLWSDDARRVGLVRPLTPTERTVLRNGSTGSGTDSAAGDTGSSAGLSEAYVGVRDTHGTPVLVDVFERANESRTAVRDIWLRFAPTAVGALLLLELIQLPLAWRLARQLHRSLRRQQRLLRAAVDASDGERRRIAGEVHDHVVQDLTGITYDLDAARLRGTGDDDAHRELLGRTAERLRSSIGDLRTLLLTWLPTHSPKERLVPALHDLAAGPTRSGIRVELTTEGLDDVPPPVATLVYRCVQEALRNVVAHSRATSVEVSVRTGEGQIMIMIDDDGRGFDEARLEERTGAGHLGLRAVGELVAHAGGSLTAFSSPGQGTRVVASVPLDASPVAAEALL